MVSNPYSIFAYRVNDVFDIQLVVPFEQATELELFTKLTARNIKVTRLQRLSLFYHGSLRFTNLPFNGNGAA